MGDGHTLEEPYLLSCNGYGYSTGSSNTNLSCKELGIAGVNQQSLTGFGCSGQEYQVVNDSHGSGATVIEQTDPIDVVADVSSLISTLELSYANTEM